MIKKRNGLLIFFIAVLAVITAISTYEMKNISSELNVQEELSQHIIRFHVRANSDSKEDQQLKLKVKDAIVNYLNPILSESESIDESRQLLAINADNIEQLAIQVLEAEGSSYGVNVYFEQSYFPMKSYGDVTFPPGVYEAFRVDIGESSGKNWWCVLYPPLCFVDASMGVLPDSSKENLKNILTDEEYNAITDSQCTYEFKYLTFLNDLVDVFNKIR